MSFVKTKDGIEIFYKDWGKGQPIVFSHGWPLSGDDWDAQYDAMEQGWGLFLRNLQLHLEHFPGKAGHAMLPTATWPGNQQAAWETIAADLGIPPVADTRILTP